MSRKKITPEMTREFRKVTAKILRKRGVKPSRADKRKARAGFEIVLHGPNDAPPGGWPLAAGAADPSPTGSPTADPRPAGMVPAEPVPERRP